MRPKSASHAIAAGAIIAAGTFSQSAATVASAAITSRSATGSETPICAYRPRSASLDLACGIASSVVHRAIPYGVMAQVRPRNRRMARAMMATLTAMTLAVKPLSAWMSAGIGRSNPKGAAKRFATAAVLAR